MFSDHGETRWSPVSQLLGALPPQQNYWDAFASMVVLPTEVYDIVVLCTDLLPLPLSNNKPPALAVKRINWHKLDRVDENTVWAKVIFTFVDANIRTGRRLKSPPKSPPLDQKTF